MKQTTTLRRNTHHLVLATVFTAVFLVCLTGSSSELILGFATTLFSGGSFLLSGVSLSRQHAVEAGGKLRA